MQCKYVYDAWGNCKIYNASGAPINYGVGQLNALRYRGYYWDEETGFYFLRTRFYDPETGRFINADDMYILLLLYYLGFIAFYLKSNANGVYYEKYSKKNTIIQYNNIYMLSYVLMHFFDSIT